MALPSRLTRRVVGVLSARLPQLCLGEVEEPRDAQGRRWPLPSILTGVVVGMCAGCKGLAEVEELTGKLTLAMRHRLVIPRRIPDTTMRDVLVELDPDSLRQSLRGFMKEAQRRKALAPTEFPVGVASMDGKDVVTPRWDDEYAQRQKHAVGGGAHGVVRTVTTCLISHRAKPCLDASPIPAHTNEMGHFPVALRELVKAYPGLLEIVMYDSGATSLENANAVKAEKLEYGLALKDNQPTLLREARRLLGELTAEQAAATTVDKVGQGELVTRRLFITEEMAGFLDWEHLRTTVRVESVRTRGEEVTSRESRYFVFSLPRGRFSDADWLKLVRLRWGVENACHNTFDTILEEDDRPFILEPRGLLAALLLRRMSYNFLTLFRSVTQRSEEKRNTPWKTLLRWFYDVLITAGPEHMQGLRPRAVALGA